MTRALVASLVLLAAGCEGLGRPVVGERQVSPRPADDACWLTRCDEVPESRDALRRPSGELGAAASDCPDRARLPMLMTDLAADEGTLDLRCADVEVIADAPFSVDLRAVPLAGATLSITAGAAGHVVLGGDLSGFELRVEGPVDVEIAGGALSRSRVWLGGSVPDRPASLAIERAIVTESVIEAPHGRVRASETMLSRPEVRALELELEVSSAVDAVLEAERMVLLDAVVSRADLSARSLVAAAGELDFVHVVRCGEATLAGLEVRNSRIARCDAPILLDDVDLDGSSIAASLRGSARLRRVALSGPRIELTDSRLTLAALCGVEVLDAADTSIECPSCDPAAPAEICGAPARPEPYCPGFELAPCDGLPRPSPGGQGP